MRIPQFISIILMLLGIFLIIMQPFAPITGAVIDVSTTPAKIWFAIGIVCIVGGAGVLVFEKRKLRKV